VDSPDSDVWREVARMMEEAQEGGMEGWQPGEEPEEEVKIPVATHVSCDISFYRLSPELYYYARALYLCQLDFLANMGLIPANFTYSNVEGGLGIVGALAGTSVSLEDQKFPPLF